MESHPPARKVVTRAPWRTVRLLNLRGIFPEPVECESSLERDFVHRIALCPSVVDVRHQPLRLDLPEGRFYTPDFLVVHCDGSTSVVEVKPASKVRRNAALFDLASQALRQQGQSFVVLTEREIRCANSHDQATFILRYRKSSIDAHDRHRVLSLFDEAPLLTLSVGSIRHRAGVDIACVLHLVATRELIASPHHDFSAGAHLARRSHKDSHHAVHVHEWFGAQGWSTDHRVGPRIECERASVRGHVDTARAHDQNLRGSQADLERSISGRARGNLDDTDAQGREGARLPV